MKFSSEHELIKTYLDIIPDSWTAYPETSGYDLILLHKASGIQVAIEAKLSLNLKVLTQVTSDLIGIPHNTHISELDKPLPDYLAVLVPWTRMDYRVTRLFRSLSVSVIMVGGRVGSPRLNMPLPCPAYEACDPMGADPMGADPMGADPMGADPITSGSIAYPDPDTVSWTPLYPTSKLILPDYIPDVSAGVKSPIRLTAWKIKALKLICIYERRGYIIRDDFKRLKLSPTLWLNSGQVWLIPHHDKNIKGWILGPGLPDFKSQHPVNYNQIMSDYNTWNLRDYEGWL